MNKTNNIIEETMAEMERLNYFNLSKDATDSVINNIIKNNKKINLKFIDNYEIPYYLGYISSEMLNHVYGCIFGCNIKVVTELTDDEKEALIKTLINQKTKERYATLISLWGSGEFLKYIIKNTCNNTEINFNRNIILIDDSIKENKEFHDFIFNHEMGHCYQREVTNKFNIIENIKKNNKSSEMENKDIKEILDLEFDADLYSASKVGKKIALESLNKIKNSVAKCYKNEIIARINNIIENA